MSKEEIIARINALRLAIEQTNEIALSYADRYITATEYKPTKDQRNDWRKEITDLQSQLEQIAKEGE